MVPPGATAEAEATCVMERSAPCTVVVIEMLFGVPGFVPVSLTVTGLLVIVVPPTAPEFTATMIVKFTDVEAAMAAFAEQTIAPVPPAAGVVPHVHPAGGVAEPATERLGAETVMGALAFEPPGLEVTESVSVPFPVVGRTVMVIVKVVVLLVW